MPSTKKQLPATTSKKKALASTKAKNGINKPGKKNNITIVNEGSYLQLAHTQSSTQGTGNTDITVQAQEHHKGSGKVASALHPCYYLQHNIR